MSPWKHGYQSHTLIYPGDIASFIRVLWTFEKKRDAVGQDLIYSAFILVLTTYIEASYGVKDSPLYQLAFQNH